MIDGPVSEIHHIADGQWDVIIPAICPIDAAILDGRQHPCPFCGGSDRFNVKADFQQTGATFCRGRCMGKGGNSDGIATVMWAKRIGVAGAIHLLCEHLGIVRAKGSGSKPPEVSDEDRQLRNRVYNWLRKKKNHNGLNTEHIQALKKRGLTDEHIKRFDYCSYDSKFRRLAGLLEKAVQEGKIEGVSCDELYRRVPGVMKGETHSRMVFPEYKGIAIPIRNADGLVVAMKVRLDEPWQSPQPGSKPVRYFYFSSSRKKREAREKLDGLIYAFAEAAVHVPEGTPHGAPFYYLTEGELKSDVSFAISGVPTLSIPGTSSWREALPVLKKLKATKFAVAMDSDFRTNHGVAEAISGLAREGKKHGFEVCLAVWPEADGKGLDDLLLSGKQPELIEGDAVEAFLKEHVNTVKTESKPAADKPLLAFPDTSTAGILNRLDIVVLGHDAITNRIKFFSRSRGYIWDIPDINRLKICDAFQYFGQEVVQREINLSLEPSPLLLSIPQIRIAIAAEGGKRRIVDEKTRGPGIWEIDGNLLMVGPGKALQVGETIEVKKDPFAGDCLLEFTGSAWYDEETIRKNWDDSASDPSWCRRAMNDAIQLFQRWDNWKHSDSPQLIAALACATWVQTVWPVRPIVGLPGGTNTGKTILLDSLKHFFNQMMLRAAKPSEPGIRQHLKNSAKALLIDELEEGPQRRAVLELLRTTMRGDQVIRGTSTQRGASFGLQHIIWIAALELGLTEATDANRVIACELLKVDTSQGSTLQIPTPAEMRDLGQRLLIVAMRHCKPAIAMMSPLRQVSYGAHDRRLVELYSLPVALLASVYGHSLEDAQHALQDHLDERHEVTEVESNEVDLLMTILMADVRVSGACGTKPVGEIIRDDSGFSDDKKALEAVGIKLIKHDSGDSGLFLHPKTVKTKLLRHTNYAAKDLKQLLARIDGATSGEQYELGLARPRGVLIPMASIARLVGGSSANPVTTF